MQSLIVAILAVLALIASVVADPAKTGAALRLAWRRFLALLPSFLTMVSVVSLVLAVVSRDTIVQYLGRERLFEASALAAALGSTLLMPGFVAFPLAGILIEHGVAKTVVASFTTTLMMVGILTFPIEKQYFGIKVTILRNVLSLAVTVAISVAIGLLYGEIG